MAVNPRFSRLPRIGDGKFSFIPNDADHNGWLLLSPTTRMLGKVQYSKLFAVLGINYGGSGASTTFGLPTSDRVLMAAGLAFPFGQTGGAQKKKLSLAQLPKFTVQKVGIATTPAQKALLATSLLGISTGDITKPPTVTDGTQEIGNGDDVDFMPPYISINVFIYGGMVT